MKTKQRIFTWSRLRTLLLGLALLIGPLLGLAQNAQAALGWQLQIVDSAGVVGLYTSLALDSSGNPVISYYDYSNDDLKLVHCGNATCSSGNTIQTVDSAGEVGLYTSLALDSSGNPVISYYDNSNGDLKLVHCGNATCSSGNTITVLDSVGVVGQYTSLVLDNSGNPVISYHDFTNVDLKLVRCGNTTCSSGNSIVTVDSAGTVGQYPSLALDSSGNPVISYYSPSFADLKLVHCGNATCSSGNTIQTVDSAGGVGFDTSLALDSSGNPVISYHHNSNGDLKLVHCGNATCSSGNTIQTVDSAGNVGYYTSLVLDSSGNPVISYFDNTNDDLKLVHCGNVNCTSGNVVQIVDSAGNVGYSTSLVLDNSGNPVISYYDASNADLKLAGLVDDSTPPSATPTQDPAANANGWNNTDVTVTWNWSDPSTGSGQASEIDPANCTTSSVSSGEGTLSLTATCKDLAGNQGSATYAVKVDKTAPIITASATKADGTPYMSPLWSNQDIIVHFTCSDDISGIASCLADQTLSTEGILPSVAGTAVDNAGNSAEAIFGPFQIDKIAPDTAISSQPTNPSASSDASFAFSGSDATSGVASFQCSLDGAAFAACTSPQNYTGLASGSHTFQVRAIDNAGNVDATPASYTWNVQTDSTPPVITPNVVGTLGSNGWYVSDVSVSWNVADSQSAISSQTGCGPVTVNSDTAGVTLLCTATSAGGTASESVTLKRDATAPTISGAAAPAANGAGWNNSAVTVSFTCADATAGVAACGPNQTLAGAGAGQTVTGTATDQAGNSATATVSNLNIDLTPPTISGSLAPAANGAGWHNSDVIVSFTCADDGGSGVASCGPNSTVASKGQNQAVSGAATDVAGNSATTTLNVSLDKTPPTATANLSHAPNVAGWYNSDVTISFSGSDALSGLAGCSAPVVISSDGAGQAATGTCSDEAGNASAPATANNINLDKTAPETQISAGPTDPNNVGDAAFSFSGSDSGSGIAKLECSLDGSAFGDCSSGSSSYSLLGSGLHTFAVRAVDVAGNEDATPAVHPWTITLPVPSIQAQLNGAQGSNGWYTGDVTLNWLIDGHGLAIDSSSGCEAQLVNSDTPGVSFTCTATSQGGTAAASVNLKRDATVPTISAAAAPAANGAGWNNGDVTVSFTCADNLAGVATCGPNQTVTTEGANQSVTGSVVDEAGNSAAATLSNLNIDKTTPTASASAAPAPNGTGWNNSAVTVSFTGSDNLAGIATCSAPVVISSDGAGQAASGSCTDNAGNVSTPATVANLNLDKTAPVVSVTGVANGASYVLGSVPTPGCSTEDLLSGVATPATLTVTGGNGVGSFTATCAGALDLAGNAGAASVTYMVHYSFNGFFQPVDNLPVLNSVKAGQSIPLKFNLAGDRGLNIFAQGYPASQQVACDGGAPVSDLVETDTAGNSGLQYDPASGQYTYVWKSEKAWAGQCRQLVVRLNDGTDHVANFKFK